MNRRHGGSGPKIATLECSDDDCDNEIQVETPDPGNQGQWVRCGECGAINWASADDDYGKEDAQRGERA